MFSSGADSAVDSSDAVSGEGMASSGTELNPPVDDSEEAAELNPPVNDSEEAAELNPPVVDDSEAIELKPTVNEGFIRIK